MIGTLIGDKISMGKSLSNLLNGSNYDRLRMMVAFAKHSGVGRLYDDCRDFLNSGGRIQAIIGIDHRGTSLQAIQQLGSLCNSNLYVHYDRGGIDFHPKVFIFEKRDNVKTMIIGSSNLTAGGLFTNYEADVMLMSQETNEDIQFVADLNGYYRSVLNDRNTKRAFPQLISKLFTQGLLFDETVNRSFSNIVSRISDLPFREGRRRQIPRLVTPLSPVRIGIPKIFAMTLSGFDVSQRSQDPVLLIPVKALKEYPLFWEWPLSFTLSGSGYPERYTTADVTISRHNTFPRWYVRIYYYKRKTEFRFQCEPIKRNGHQGDIVVIEKCNTRKAEYKIELIPVNSTRYFHYSRICSSEVSPQKSYGYQQP